MSVIRTAIPKVEASITKYENRLEEGRIREDEARYGDQGRPDLMGNQTHTKDQSPASDTSSMTGDMARLQVHTPPREETEDGGTLKYA